MTAMDVLLAVSLAGLIACEVWDFYTCRECGQSFRCAPNCAWRRGRR